MGLRASLAFGAYDLKSIWGLGFRVYLEFRGKGIMESSEKRTWNLTWKLGLHMDLYGLSCRIAHIIVSSIGGYTIYHS